ncbi:MAG: hypothetical protein LLG04_06300 [Parachlamydia sp.]|nr:hypothetical protein [Parachlamydia sp.]
MNTITKFFIGCPLTSELRMHLKESSAWNQASIDPDRNLIEVRFQKQDYLGRYYDGQQLELRELKQIETDMRARMQSYCPKLNSEKLAFCVFPQIFLP